jgi:hypothetical protein
MSRSPPVDLSHTSRKIGTHPTISAPAGVIPFHRRLTPIVPPYNDTYGDELVNPLLLLEQLIGT